MKIVVLDGYTENPGDLSWDELGKLGDLTVYDRTADGDIVSRIGDAELVITNKTPISRDTWRGALLSVILESWRQGTMLWTQGPQRKREFR